MNRMLMQRRNKIKLKLIAEKKVYPILYEMLLNPRNNLQDKMMKELKDSF